ALAADGNAAVQGRAAGCTRHHLGRVAGGCRQPGDRTAAALLSARARRQEARAATVDTVIDAAMLLWPFDLLLAMFAAFWTDNSNVIVPTATGRDAPQLADIHAASFHRGWSEDEFDRMLAERNTLVHVLRIGSKIIGFAISRIGADEAEILS